MSTQDSGVIQSSQSQGGETCARRRNTENAANAMKVRLTTDVPSQIYTSDTRNLIMSTINSPLNSDNPISINRKNN